MPGDRVALLLQAEDAPLHVSNCRFVHLVEGHKAGWVSLWALRCPTLWLNNSQFVQKDLHSVIKWECVAGEKGLISNCVVSSSLDIVYRKGTAPVSLNLERNSFAASNPLRIFLYGRPDPERIKKDQLIQLRSLHNLFGGPLAFVQPKDSIPKEGPLAADDAAQLLQQLVRWEEKRNLFGIAPGNSFLRFTAQSVLQKPTREVLSLADWQSYWRLDPGDSLQGLPKFEGANVYSRGKVHPADLLPMDYRLAPESPGKGAGPGGKDLGADVDLVGPGAAYERWKQTPEYQEWRKKTETN